MTMHKAAMPEQEEQRHLEAARAESALAAAEVRAATGLRAERLQVGVCDRVPLGTPLFPRWGSWLASAVTLCTGLWLSAHSGHCLAPEYLDFLQFYSFRTVLRC